MKKKPITVAVRAALRQLGAQWRSERARRVARETLAQYIGG